MDPFRILNLRRRADTREIIRAAALAFRERRHPARDVALAQDETILSVVKTGYMDEDRGEVLRKAEVLTVRDG